jgi:hypothetical protein
MRTDEIESIPLRGPLPAERWRHLRSNGSDFRVVSVKRVNRLTPPQHPSVAACRQMTSRPPSLQQQQQQQPLFVHPTFSGTNGDPPAIGFRQFRPHSSALSDKGSERLDGASPRPGTERVGGHPPKRISRQRSSDGSFLPPSCPPPTDISALCQRRGRDLCISSSRRKSDYIGA